MTLTSLWHLTRDLGHALRVPIIPRPPSPVGDYPDPARHPRFHPSRVEAPAPTEEHLMDRDTSDARAADPMTEYRDAADPSLAERMAPELLPLLEHPGYRVPDPTATIRLEGPDGADLEVRLAHPAIGQGDLLRMAAEAADHLRIDLEERLKTARCTEVSPTGHRCELPYGHDDTAHEAVKAGRWA